MPNKLLTIGAAVAVAALVLLLAVITGGPGSGARDNTSTIPENPDIFLGGAESENQLPVGISQGFYYESHDGGRLMRITGDQLMPLPDGVGKLTPMDVKIELAPGRELAMTADQAIVVAPDNHPREGEMSGNVVVTLYETPDGSPVDFDSERHIVTRFYFDEPVQFDLELQQIDSDGPIFMTGPQVQFLGKGLSLNYNQRRHRIERLVIEQGQSLHYIPEPKATFDSPPPNAPAPSAEADSSAVALQEQTQLQKKPARSANVPNTDPPDSTPSDAGDRPVQFYLATFEQLNDVRVGQDQYVIEGDDLSAVFSANAAGGLDDTEPADSTDTPGDEVGVIEPSPTIASRQIQLASSDPLRGALLHALTASIGQLPANTHDPRSLAAFTDEDVVITWAGRLVITPLSDVPDELAGPDDVMVVVKGSPATILTDRSETIIAPKRVSFFSQNARLLVEGTDTEPFTVDALGLGTLIGRELSIDQLHGSGYVLGPGKLVGLIKNDEQAPADNQTNAQPTSQTPSPDTRHPIPDRITVAFDNQLDLEFYLKDKADTSKQDTRSPAGGSRIKSVKSATFTGDVAVDYIELDMTADRLTLAMLEDAPKGEGKLAVSALDAYGNIRADVKDQDVKILADRLHAEPAKDQLELFGTPENHAQVIRPDATLAGEHLVMDQQARTVNVVGPGSFDYIPDLAEPDKTVRVAWDTSMDFDDAKGTAHFLGNVRTFSADGTDTNELMGDKLDMVFVKDDTADDSKADEDSATRGDRTAGRRLATATMTGNVRFRARSYANAQHLRPDLMTELFLTDSQKMVFTDPGTGTPEDSSEALQKVHVFGHGRMLITENRSKDQTAATAKPVNSKSIDFGGRGLTAFQWSDGLIINMTDGIMTMKGAVAMVHDPEDGDRVQLDCTDLAAELQAPTKSKWVKSSGGGWLSKDAPKPQLQRVWADGGIRILQGPYTIHCDHLLYQEAKRDILLWSDDPRQVTYEVNGEPNLTKSSALKWHRDTGRIEVFKIRTGTIPIRRSEQKSD